MIPIHDNSRRRRTPWVNYSLIAANFGVFLYMMLLGSSVPALAEQAAAEFAEQTATICYGFETPPTDIDRFYCRWGFQPREWLDTVQGNSLTPSQPAAAVAVTIVTAVFLHAGWLHIIGNMVFLWVFGDNIEDRFGHAGYLIFYVLAGVVASLTQLAIETEEIIPNVGASGAVAGVLGAYLVYFPKATITTLIPIAIVFIPFPIPAVVMIGIWFLQNLLAGIATLGPAAGPAGSVAFFAHIGGFVFGAGLVLLFFRNLGQPRRRVAGGRF